MIKIRFLVVVLIILITGIILQAFNVINVENLFRRNSALVHQDELPALLSSSVIPETFDRIIILFEKDSADEDPIADHLRQTLQNSRMQYTEADIGSEECSKLLSDVRSSDSLVLTTASIQDFSDSDFSSLTEAVTNGTSLTILAAVVHPVISKLAGIEQVVSRKAVVSEGLTFVEEFFPLMDEIDSESEIFTYESLQMATSDGIQPIAISAEKDPLIWQFRPAETDYGGTVLYTNSSLFIEKVNRGLMLQLIHYNTDYALSYITAGKLLSLDAFPAPLPSGKAEIIYSDYQRDNIKFFKEIWWTDLQNIQNRQGIGLTGFAQSKLQTSTTLPLAPITEDERETISLFGELLGESDAELGILGYNGVPLLLKEEITAPHSQITAEDFWPSQHTVAAGLQDLRDLMESIYGDLSFISYAAPDGAIGATGKDAILDMFPDIRILSGIYTEYASSSQLGNFIQEFGPDPEIEDVYSIPRFSYGYKDDTETLWPILNGIAELGLFNHSIHSLDLLNQTPEDMPLDDDEQGEWEPRRWDKLLRDLEEILSILPREFPYLNGMTYTDIYNSRIRNEKLEIYTQRSESTITMNLINAYLPLKLYLRCDTSISNVKGGILRTLSSDNLYVLEVRKPDVTLQLRK